VFLHVCICHTLVAKLFVLLTLHLCNLRDFSWSISLAIEDLTATVMSTTLTMGRMWFYTLPQLLLL